MLPADKRPPRPRNGKSRSIISSSSSSSSSSSGRATQEGSTSQSSCHPPQCQPPPGLVGRSRGLIDGLSGFFTPTHSRKWRPVVWPIYRCQHTVVDKSPNVIPCQTMHSQSQVASSLVNKSQVTTVEGPQRWQQ